MLKGKIDYTFNEQAVRIAPSDRHFTATTALLSSLARMLEDSMRQRNPHTLTGSIDFVLRCTQDAAVNGCETLDDVQIAIERDARKNGVYQGAETSSRRPVGWRAAARQFLHAASFKSGADSSPLFAAWVTVLGATEL